MIGLQKLHFFTIFFFVSSGFAQSKSNVAIEWTQIKDEKSEFSISFPSNFLVDNEMEKSYIIAPGFASLPEHIDSFEKPETVGDVMSLSPQLAAPQLLFYFRHLTKNFFGGD